MNDIYKTYPHTPPHWFVPNAIYMVTGAILHKQNLLKTDIHKEIICNTLIERTALLGWQLQAWSVMTNHYHFIAQSPENALSLQKLIRQFHSITAHQLNLVDRTPGRQVWHNYWDSCITHEKSYLARLRYVHFNPLKHGVNNIEDYPFCSYRWLIEVYPEELRTQVISQPIDRLKIVDDF